MARKTDYPRASFLRALELAEAVDSLGSKSTREMSAAKINRQHTSGSFASLVAAAVKHRLIITKPDYLQVTELYKEIKLAYDDAEKRKALVRSFLIPPIYNSVYQRFLNRELPVAILERLLVREFDVDKGIASRVAGYFKEGVKYLNLLVDGKLVEVEVDSQDSDENAENEAENYDQNEFSAADNQVQLFQEQNSVKQQSHNINYKISDTSYVVHIYGPGMDSKIELSEPEDFLILEAMLSKLKKKVEKSQKEEV